MFSGCGGLGTTACALPGAIKVHAAAGGNGEHGSCDDVGEESASSQRPAVASSRRQRVPRGVSWGIDHPSLPGWWPGCAGSLRDLSLELPLPTRQRSPPTADPAAAGEGSIAMTCR